MTKSRYVVKDKGYRKALATIREVATGYITVGIHGDQVTKDGVALALVASANEFGTKDGHVPERSFIRSTLDTKRPELVQVRNRALKQVVAGRISVRTGLGLMGAFLKGEIQATIASSVPPPNAPSTIRAKGSSVTLIDTGQLRQGIDYQVHVGDREAT